MAFVIIAVASLGIVLSNTVAKEQNEVYSSDDSKMYFKSAKVDQTNSLNVKLNITDNKSLAVYALTDYKTGQTDNVSFRYQEIKSNIMSLFKEVIANDSRFYLINNFYINIKFEIINNKTLMVDSRWANKRSIMANIQTELYWEKMIFSL